VQLAINNSLNNLIGYPHNATSQEWSHFVRVSRDELKSIYIKWSGGRNGIR